MILRGSVYTPRGIVAAEVSTTQPTRLAVVLSILVSTAVVMAGYDFF